MIVERVAQVSIWHGQEAVHPCDFHGHPPPKIKSVSFISFFFPSFLSFSIWGRASAVQEPERQFAPPSHPFQFHHRSRPATTRILAGGRMAPSIQSAVSALELSRSKKRPSRP